MGKFMKLDMKEYKNWNSWELNSLQKRMELLNVINSNSHRTSQVSIFKLSRQFGELSTVMNYIKDFIEQGYLNRKERTQRAYEYELTQQGVKYLNKYLNNKNKIIEKLEKLEKFKNGN